MSAPNVSDDAETTPLLQLEPQRPRKKPFYRARPLWLVPFAIVAALVRGMTLAPRVEVFTQLACNRLHGDHKWNHSQTNASLQLHQALYSSLDPLGPHFSPDSIILTPRVPISLSDPSDTDDKDSDDTEDPRRLPSARCLADPAVQAGAARLQTIMTTAMGLLSALTTGWWGHFGERHGRTKVLATATFGLFLTDLTFILVSTPGSVLAQHGHKLLVLAPIIEGMLGGWSTLQSASSAYLSDCTSPGSRAHIFSRFQGVFYLGFAVGPTIGGWLIQHPFGGGERSVTTVFWAAVTCSFINFMLVLLVFPESLDKKKQERALRIAAAAAAKGTNPPVHSQEETVASGSGSSSESDQEDSDSQTQGSQSRENIVMRFLRPLAVFLPVVVLEVQPGGLGARKRRDWSLTLLAGALFAFMLSTGLFQIKYLYAAHTFGWGVEQLSYYISFMGGGRALWLLFLLPTIIGFLKPKPRAPPSPGSETGDGTAVVPGRKPRPTRAQLGKEISFDLVLARCSFFVDIVSHSLVAALPGPGYKAHSMSVAGLGQTLSDRRSEALFVLASSLNGLGSGAVPAVHSLALCMLQVRALDAHAASGNDGTEVDTADDGHVGALFGALAVLQAVGQMILGPMLFGLIYSETVATFPKAIFVVGAGLVLCALTLTLCVRNPVRPPRAPSSPHSVNRSVQGSFQGSRGGFHGPPKRRRGDGEGERRGRSRVSKDLRGGAVGYLDYGATEGA